MSNDHDDFPPLVDCIDPMRANEAARQRIREAYGDHDPNLEQFERMMGRYLAKRGEVADDSRPPINAGNLPPLNPGGARVEVKPAPVDAGRERYMKDVDEFYKRKGIRRW